MQKYLLHIVFLPKNLLFWGETLLKPKPPGDAAAEVSLGEAAKSGSPNEFVSPPPALSLSLQLDLSLAADRSCRGCLTYRESFIPNNFQSLLLLWFIPLQFRSHFSQFYFCLQETSSILVQFPLAHTLPVAQICLLFIFISVFVFFSSCGLYSQDLSPLLPWSVSESSDFVFLPSAFFLAWYLTVVFAEGQGEEKGGGMRVKRQNFGILAPISARDAQGTAVGWAQYCPVFHSYIHGSSLCYADYTLKRSNFGLLWNFFSITRDGKMQLFAQHRLFILCIGQGRNISLPQFPPSWSLSLFP